MIKHKTTIDSDFYNQIDHDRTRDRIFQEVIRTAAQGSKFLAKNVPVGPTPPVGDPHAHMKNTIGYHGKVDVNDPNFMTAIVTIHGPHIRRQNYEHKTKRGYLEKTHNFMEKDLLKRVSKTRLIVLQY